MSSKDLTVLVKRYEQAIESGKTPYFDADEFSDLAEFFDSQNDIETAREIVESGLYIHPESDSLKIKKAKFLAYDGDYSSALRLISASMTSEYDYDLYMLKTECYLQLGLFVEAHEMTKIILDNEGDQMESTLAEIGYLYVEADLFDEAILYFNKSLEYNSENVEVLSDLSYAYEMLADFDSAIDATNKILDIDSYTYDAWVNLGKLYSLQDNFDKAVEAFDFALTINDSDSNIVKLKAHCLSLCGRTEEAIRLFQELLIERPHDTSIYFLLAESYQTLGRDSDALACLINYSDAINSTPKETVGMIDENNMDAALEVVKQSLATKEDSPELNMVAGDILFKQEKYDDAFIYFEKAYNLDPEDISTIDRMAIIAIKQNRNQDAIDLTQKILEQEPQNKEAKLRLTLLYFEEYDEAQFAELVDDMSEDDLNEVFRFIYQRTENVGLSRELLIDAIKKAKACRMLFNNIHY